MLDRLAEIRKGDYTTFSLLLRQCPWPLDSLQGPDEGLGFPGSICVVSVFTRSLRSTSETKVGTAWCNKTGLSLFFFGLYPIIWLISYPISSNIGTLHFQRSGLELPRAAAVSTAVAVL